MSDEIEIFNFNQHGKLKNEEPTEKEIQQNNTRYAYSTIFLRHTNIIVQGILLIHSQGGFLFPCVWVLTNLHH